MLIPTSESTRFHAFELDKIYCGDCAEVMAGWPDECIDLAVTSPPYDNLRSYNGYVFNFEVVATQLFRVTKKGGVVVWVVADQTVNGSETGTSFRQALHFISLGFNLHDTMIYKVPGTGAKGSRLSYWQSFEYMFVLSKGKPKSINLIKDKRNKKFGSISTSGKKQNNIGTRLHPRGGTIIQEYGYRDNVWEILPGNNGDDETEHPAQFPEELPHDHILSWSVPNDTVLDPMCGSGTTLKMAKELSRHWVGIDISQEYCDLSQRRVDGAKVPLPGKWE